MSLSSSTAGGLVLYSTAVEQSQLNVPTVLHDSLGNPIGTTNVIPTTVISSYTISPAPTTTLSSSTNPPVTPPISNSTSAQQGTNRPQTTALATTPPAHPPDKTRLANGTVAGVVVGAAAGVGLLAFLATFLCMRHKRASRKTLQQQTSRQGGVAGASSTHLDPARHAKGPIMTEKRSDSPEGFLPQSADDYTVRNRVKTVLDQIEYHVENFYQNAGTTSMTPTTNFAPFESPHLPSPASVLLQQTENRRAIIKHSLAQIVTSSLAPSTAPARSLLPIEFTQLPRVIDSTKSITMAKPGKSRKGGNHTRCLHTLEIDRSISQWRVLTAYLRPSPADDRAYLAERRKFINSVIRAVTEAFRPWRNAKYTEAERDRSLAAILEESADLGIFIFSQRSLLQFRWPKPNELGTTKVAVTPAFVRMTDERGNPLSEGQVLIDYTIQKL